MYDALNAHSKALRKAIRLFCQQGFAATSTDDLMRVMAIGRQSMYDTFGDKRALFLKALEMYVIESIHFITVELERRGSALSAVQNALVTFAERKDLSSAEGCMGLNTRSPGLGWRPKQARVASRFEISHPLREEHTGAELEEEKIDARPLEFCNPVSDLPGSA